VIPRKNVLPQKSRREKSRATLQSSSILDGALLDTVYDHGTAWSTVPASAGIVVPKRKIHRRIGVSGKSLVRQLLREAENFAKSPMYQP